MKSIMDTEATMETTSHPFESQQRVLQILGCSKQDVMADDKLFNRSLTAGLNGRPSGSTAHDDRYKSSRQEASSSSSGYFRIDDIV